MTSGSNLSQSTAARLAGAMFLYVNVVGAFSEVFVRGSLFTGDAAQTANNIVGSELLFRLAIVVDLVMLVGAVVLIWALYVLLRPVNRDVALLSMLFRVVEITVTVTAALGSMLAVRMLVRGDLGSLATGDLQGLSRLGRIAFSYGQDVGFIFLGFGSLGFAYLLLKSGYIPRVIAAWGMFASAVMAAYNLVIVVFPAVADQLMMVFLAPMGVYELGIGLWLLIKGARLNA